MENNVKILLASLLIIVSASFLTSASLTSKKVVHETIEEFSCLNVSPGVLTFGLRGNPKYQDLEVTIDGTWGAYVSASWIKINGGGTISSGGNATVTVSLANPIPASPPTLCGGGYITTGTITFYGGGCGNVQVLVEYYVCPCC